MTAPVDQAVRERALDPARSFIVQAPAGSGKTELLVQRYLRLLSRADEPDAVLAITFTRKAAAEMRERVARSLREAASPSAEAPLHRQLSLELARQVLEQSRKRGWDLPDNPARLRIITIDSLGSWLAVSSPISSGGGALGNLRTDAARLYMQASRTMLYDGIRQGDRDVELLLKHLDGSGQKFIELVAAMLGKREQWLPLLGVSRSREAFDKPLRGLVRRETDRALDCLNQARKEFESAFAENWINQDEPRDPLHPQALGGWKRAAEDLLTRQNRWRVRFKKKLGEELETEIRASSEFRERLARLRTMEFPAYADSRLELVRSVLRVLRGAYAQLKVLFANHRETDYTEVSQAALTALGHGDRPSFLAERLDARLRHILVDEFQDTSRAQLDLLQQMVRDWQDGDGRTVFMVGDPMQSIYGFREADVRGYLRVCEHGLGALRPELLQLTVNFRSAPDLVAWFNRVFPEVFPADGDSLMGTVPYTPCYPAPSAKPGNSKVKLHFFRKGDHESEVEIVERIVRESLQEQPGNKIGILVRSRTHGEEVSHALGKTGIAVSRTEFDRRKRFSVVQDLAALARALSQPADRIAWMAVLRAPWCGLTLRDLHALSHDAPGLTVWELVSDAERVQQLNTDGQERLARTVPVLERALNLRGQLDFRSWVEGAWLALGGPAGNTDENAARHAAEFLDSLGEVSRGSSIDDAVSRTLELTDQFVTNPETGADVQIMTMHKAKGLEFDTVILPGLGRAVHSETAPVLRWWQPPPGDTSLTPDGAASTLLAVRPAQRKDGADPVYTYLDTLAKAREDAERRRLLYVATTRARTHLHLLVGLVRQEDSLGPGEFKPTARVMAADLEVAMRKLLKAKPPDHLPPKRRNLRTRRLAAPRIHRVPSGWTPPDPPAPRIAPRPAEIQSPSYIWAGERARVLGLAVHRWLQEIAEQGPDAYPPERLEAMRPRIRRILQYHGVPADDSESLSADVLIALGNTLADERGRWALEPHDDAASELPLSLLEEGRTRSLILDRTFVADGARWIVDYKTSRHEGGDLEGFLDEEERRYSPQLERYRLAMQELENRPIRTALYFPWHSAFREVVE